MPESVQAVFQQFAMSATTITTRRSFLFMCGVNFFFFFFFFKEPCFALSSSAVNSSKPAEHTAFPAPRARRASAASQFQDLKYSDSSTFEDSVEATELVSDWLNHSSCKERQNQQPAVILPQAYSKGRLFAALILAT